jgi:CheY-like chemotaxis protein
LEAITPAPLETAVVIIDYGMPNIDGITLCKALRDHPAKKLMLTGQADHFIGVQAFNEGLIDRFVLKSSKNTGKLVRDAVEELQHQYFQGHSHFIWDEVTFETHQKFMKDVLFVQFFKQLVKAHHIEAFYLWKDGSRFLFRNHKQQLFWLMLYDQTSLHRIVEKAEYVHEQEPLSDNEALLSKIKNHTELPCFYPSFDDAWSLKDWAPFLHPVTVTQGSLDTYYYALIPATGLYRV